MIIKIINDFVNHILLNNSQKLFKNYIKNDKSQRRFFLLILKTDIRAHAN